MVETLLSGFLASLRLPIAYRSLVRPVRMGPVSLARSARARCADLVGRYGMIAVAGMPAAIAHRPLA